ncbi:MAG: hypothetical protein Q7R41_06500 [Phycisphaerales bacterium]|nr:hypothetical protein [Phycisphaerales bacterium]
MFGPDGKKFFFRGDLSFFDDAKGVYAWCFEGEVWDGNKIVFATSDRQIEGMVIDGAIVIQSAEPVILRGVEGKPLGDGTPGTPLSPAAVASAAEKESRAAVAVASKAMEPPHPRMRPRPIPMPRLK